MIGAAVRIFFTFTEKFKRDQFESYCMECGKQFSRGKGLTLWCGRRCAKRSAKRYEAPKPANEIGNIYHRPGG